MGEQLSEGGLIVVTRAEVGELSKQTYFELTDGSSVILYRPNPNRATLTWPMGVGAKEFMTKATQSLGIDTPDELDVITFKDPRKIKMSEVDKTLGEDTGVEIKLPESRTRLSWFNNSFNPGNTPEGGVDLPDLTAIDVGELMGATGSDAVIVGQTELVEKILEELNLPLE